MYVIKSLLKVNLLNACTIYAGIKLAGPVKIFNIFDIIDQ